MMKSRTRNATPFRFAACLAALLAVSSPLKAAEKDEVTLHVFGPELPFMFHVTGGAKEFAWSDLMGWGDAGVGTLTEGIGEVIGIGGAFYVADPADPTPRPISDEMTPTGAVLTFASQQFLEIRGPVDLAGLQDALDRTFVDTDTFVYVFKAHVMLSSVEYQLAGPRPSGEIMAAIESGNTQEAVTIGTQKFRAENVAATLVGIRAPLYLDTVFETPYHIHFLADDKSRLGHVTALEATDLEVGWARTKAINVRYWDPKSEGR